MFVDYLKSCAISEEFCDIVFPVGVFSIIINEEMLCISRKNKIESFECKGTMALSYKLNEGSHSNHNTASTILILKDEKNVLCEVKGNPVFILSPIEPKGETRKIKIQNILVQNSGKLFPIMKYSTVSEYQPQYFKARSKLLTQIPNSKLLVQIILNPSFHNLFENPQNFQIQALLSCFNFDEKSEVKVRSCDNFNVNTKILTWVESLHDVKKETIISLEALIQGMINHIRKICLYACIYVCICACMYVCMCVRMYICMYVCMYLCMYVRMYVCTYI